MSQLNVLVVGASIAGPTTAYWLAKAGHNVTIIERFAELRTGMANHESPTHHPLTQRTGGQAVDIRTTGVTVMNKMPGVESAVRAKRPPVDGWSLVNDEGKSFAKIMPSGDPNKQSMISEYEIFRGDLNKILYDVTVDNKRIQYVFDEQVASMKQSGDGDGPITIEFLNGHLPTAEYDLVVSCDGSHSRTRAMGFNCAVRDNLISNNCWAAYCTIKHDLLSASTMAEGHSSVGGRFIAVGQKGPPGQNTVMFQRFCSGPGADPTKEFREAQKTGVDALYKYIEKDFQGSGWRTEEILTMVKDAEDLYASELCQVKMPELSRGRFVLVGDAGYSSVRTDPPAGSHAISDFV